MPTDRPRKLLDQVREAIQRKHYSPRTAESYVHWIKRFIFFHHSCSYVWPSARWPAANTSRIASTS